MTNPLAFAKTSGLPIISLDSPALSLSSFAAARNLGTGLTTLTLIADGQRKAVGMCSMCGFVVAYADTWTCAKFAPSEGKADGHAIMGTIVGLLGGGMYWANT